MKNGVNTNTGDKPIIIKRMTPDGKIIEEVVQQSVPATNISPMTGQAQEVYPTYQMPGVTNTAPNVPSTPVVEEKKEEVKPEEKPVDVSTEEKVEVTTKPKKKNKLSILIIILLIAALAGLYFFDQQTMNRIRNDFSPVSTSGEEKELDVNSTIVQDLYNKVSTNIREDIANPNFDDNLKRYLAYRNMPTRKIYDSNCNLFSATSMMPYTCTESSDFYPTAFTEESLQLELRKLFGEYTKVENANIQLSTVCLGGYQYIEKRGEYVEGFCQEENTTVFRADKSLKKATSRESTITLYEEVKYVGNEGATVPEYLVSGTYVYTFKLDPNYNYVLLSRELQQ